MAGLRDTPRPHTPAGPTTATAPDAVASGAAGPLAPAHGRSTLAEVMPAVAARLGVPGRVDVFGLPEAQRFVVVLVDGLGRRLLQRHLLEAPYLSMLFGDAHPVTTAVPSTTATSITSLGTGLAPGAHGIAGYTFRRPGTATRMNALTWDNGPDDVEAFQPSATVFEQAAAQGVSCSAVVLPRFEGTGLTRAALRGARFVGVEDAEDAPRIEAVVRAATASGRTLTYVYERRLDHTGHKHGCESPRWARTLQRIDGFLGKLREALPDDVALLVTGDHGMVDVPPGHRIEADTVPGLMGGVRLLAGEARLRQLYADDPLAAPAIARRWQKHLGDRAWVRTRQDAEQQGWFGAPGATDPAMLERFGDVLVAMRDDWAVLWPDFAPEYTLVGMHGSLTPDETEVALLVDHPASELEPGAQHG